MTLQTGEKRPQLDRGYTNWMLLAGETQHVRLGIHRQSVVSMHAQERSAEVAACVPFAAVALQF